jgi:hypothetical protein
MILEAAINGRAAAVVTYNTKAFAGGQTAVVSSRIVQRSSWQVKQTLK